MTEDLYTVFIVGQKSGDYWESNLASLKVCLEAQKLHRRVYNYSDVKIKGPEGFIDKGIRYTAYAEEEDEDESEYEQDSLY